jgi:hypothetical protein
MAYFSLLAHKISITTSLENVDIGLEPSHPTSDSISVHSLCVVLVRILNLLSRSVMPDH